MIINIVKQLDYRIDRIEIADVEEDTYYASIYIVDKEGNEEAIDARPSDAIAVAIRVDAPIMISASVLATGSVSTDPSKDEEEAEEFKSFVQSLKPSDFEKMLKDKGETEKDN